MRRGAGGSGIAVLVTAAALGLSATPAAAASSRDRLRAAQLRELIREGPVSRTGLQVIGTLDLRDSGVIRSPFSCRYCTFYGGVLARRVVFERTFDLSGTLVRGPVDFEEARFGGPALFGAPPAVPSHVTLFSEVADFRLARFDQLATFEGAVFKRSADFTLARFGSDVIFAGAEVGGRAVFERTLFSGPADFLRMHFDMGADFARARFGERVSFTQSLYLKETADFSDARFGDDADFRGAFFLGGRGTSPYSANFNGASAAGDLDFGAATFSLPAPAAFQDAISAGSISFTGASLPSDQVLVMTNLAARNLFIAVPDVLRSVQPLDEQHTLALLETTAQARGDLAVANDALYAKRVLISRDYAWPGRLLDVVFYRWIAGYLVRPFRPLLVFALVAALVTLLRSPRSRQLRLDRRRLAHLRLGAGGYIHNYLDTLSLVGRSGSAAGDRRLEVLVYRVLLVCALIGLANSNPTLREMIDALR